VVAPVCTTLHHNSIPRLEDAATSAHAKDLSRARQGRGGGSERSRQGLRPAPYPPGLIVVHQQHASSQQKASLWSLPTILFPHREDVAVIGR
jgi:hypothetical protein